jgi:hypothetical protein
MTDKRATRKDLPKREFDSDLNSPALSNVEDPPVDQRDSDDRGDHRGSKDNRKRGHEHPEGEHDLGGADNLSR